jgi:hypothetical protein
MKLYLTGHLEKWVLQDEIIQNVKIMDESAGMHVTEMITRFLTKK